MWPDFKTPLQITPLDPPKTRNQPDFNIPNTTTISKETSPNRLRSVLSSVTLVTSMGLLPTVAKSPLLMTLIKAPVEEEAKVVIDVKSGVPPGTYTLAMRGSAH